MESARQTVGGQDRQKVSYNGFVPPVSPGNSLIIVALLVSAGPNGIFVVLIDRVVKMRRVGGRRRNRRKMLQTHYIFIHLRIGEITALLSLVIVRMKFISRNSPPVRPAYVRIGVNPEKFACCKAGLPAMF